VLTFLFIFTEKNKNKWHRRRKTPRRRKLKKLKENVDNILLLLHQLNVDNITTCKKKEI